MKIRKNLLAASTLLAFVAAPAMAHEAGTWIVRGGVGMVSPKSGNLDLGSVDLGGGLQLTGASVEVDDGTSLVLSGTYMFTENWAFDILAAWPFNHDIDVTATIDDGVNPPTAGTVRLGETDHLPPTFSIQYHFIPDGTIQPYVGLGLNYTTFLDTEVSGDAEAAGISDLDLDDSFGIAAQVGADWMLNDNWLVNLDIRWINIESDAALTLSNINPPVTADVGTVEIDPWVYAINIGYRF